MNDKSIVSTLELDPLSIHHQHEKVTTESGREQMSEYCHWSKNGQSTAERTYSKNRDVHTGPLACPLACSFAPLTRSLATHGLLGSRASLR